ncbi:MAG: hypothetical protein ACRELX_18675, partial [Longimicrobiales bacterium]
MSQPLRHARDSRPAGILLATAVLALLLAFTAGSPATGNQAPAAIDPQQVQDQDDMTWDDYAPIPGHDW